MLLPAGFGSVISQRGKEVCGSPSMMDRGRGQSVPLFVVRPRCGDFVVMPSSFLMLSEVMRRGYVFGQAESSATTFPGWNSNDVRC